MKRINFKDCYLNNALNLKNKDGSLLNYKSETRNIHRIIIGELAFNNLSLANYIVSLTFINCSIDDKFITFINEQCPVLQNLFLMSCNKITRIEKSFFSFNVSFFSKPIKLSLFSKNLDFAELKSIKIVNCSNLTHLHISAEKLEQLEVKNNANLYSIFWDKIITKNLKTLNFDCPKILNKITAIKLHNTAFQCLNKIIIEKAVILYSSIYNDQTSTLLNSPFKNLLNVLAKIQLACKCIQEKEENFFGPIFEKINSLLKVIKSRLDEKDKKIIDALFENKIGTCFNFTSFYYLIETLLKNINANHKTFERPPVSLENIYDNLALFFECILLDMHEFTNTERSSSSEDTEEIKVIDKSENLATKDTGDILEVLEKLEAAAKIYDSLAAKALSNSYRR
ncbi:MAG: hypothetical protein K1060chlam4_00322 [Candidatus Anoxychlamydiales bacterium]|nr:hypothetical protein [Candidatus Anoxychlamydiales bacterium]